MTHKWPKWIKPGATIKLTRLVDFNCLPDSFAQQARNAASARGLALSVAVEGESVTLTVPPCCCGSGNYCKAHRSYRGKGKLSTLEMNSSHALLHTQRTPGILNQKCGGGRRLLGKIKGTGE